MLKNWLREHNHASHIYRQDIVKAMIIGTLLGASFIFGFYLRGFHANYEKALWTLLVFAPELEICALCENGRGISYHTPVLVNLSTGEVGELQVYDPDPRHCNELAEVQSTGTFSFIYVAGLIGYRDTCDHSSNVTLPKEKEPITPSYFCHDCRTILTGTANEGYILADLYNPGEIVTYAIENNTTYTIRDYDISISSRDKSNELSIRVIGL